MSIDNTPAYAAIVPQEIIDSVVVAENNLKLTQDNPPVELLGWTSKRAEACSEQICANNHSWAPQLAIPHCGECKNPLIALRQVNCPICNEPVVKTRLRIDHLAGTHPITKTCQKEYHIGPEYIVIEIDHIHSAWVTEGTQPTNPKTQSQVTTPKKLAPPAQD